MRTTTTSLGGSSALRAQLRTRNGDGLVVVLRGAGDPGAGSDRASGADAPSRHYEVIDLPVGRSTVGRLTMLQPDVAVIHHDPRCFDVVALCGELRAGVACRIIVVAGDHIDEATTIAALDAGADDVVGNDTSAAVLDARVRVALRAHPPRPAGQATLEIGDVTIDPRAHTVHVAGEVVRCPPVQYVLLCALAEQPNVALAHTELLRTVWGARPGDVHPRRLRIAVSVLRGILGDGPRRPVIESIPRLGYRLVDPTHRR